MRGRHRGKSTNDRAENSALCFSENFKHFLKVIFQKHKIVYNGKLQKI
jgi:hypothetical protein